MPDKQGLPKRPKKFRCEDERVEYELFMPGAAAYMDALEGRIDELEVAAVSDSGKTVPEGVLEAAQYLEREHGVWRKENCMLPTDKKASLLVNFILTLTAQKMDTKNK